VLQGGLILFNLQSATSSGRNMEREMVGENGDILMISPPPMRWGRERKGGRPRSDPSSSPPRQGGHISASRVGKKREGPMKNLGASLRARKIVGSDQKAVTFTRTGRK